MWDLAHLVGIVRDTLAMAERESGAQHAVRGLDGLDELAFHPVIAAGLRSAGYGVVREQGFPGEPHKRPADRERERCDLVLLEDPLATLADPVMRLREEDSAVGTLFERHELQRGPDDRVVPTTDAFWLEIKSVGQFVIIDGYAQPNRSYSSSLVGAIAQDVRKIARDEHIDHGGVLLILFTADEATARHDLDQALHRCLDRNVPLGHPEVESFPIADRIGNASCLVALIPARRE
jgi:hypothetical protein